MNDDEVLELEIASPPANLTRKNSSLFEEDDAAGTTDPPPPTKAPPAKVKHGQSLLRKNSSGDRKDSLPSEGFPKRKSSLKDMNAPLKRKDSIFEDDTLAQEVPKRRNSSSLKATPVMSPPQIVLSEVPFVMSPKKGATDEEFGLDDDDDEVLLTPFAAFLDDNEDDALNRTPSNVNTLMSQVEEMGRSMGNLVTNVDLLHRMAHELDEEITALGDCVAMVCTLMREHAQDDDIVREGLACLARKFSPAAVPALVSAGVEELVLGVAREPHIANVLVVLQSCVAHAALRSNARVAISCFGTWLMDFESQCVALDVLLTVSGDGGQVDVEAGVRFCISVLHAAIQRNNLPSWSQAALVFVAIERLRGGTDAFCNNVGIALLVKVAGYKTAAGEKAAMMLQRCWSKDRGGMYAPYVGSLVAILDGSSSITTKAVLDVLLIIRNHIPTQDDLFVNAPAALFRSLAGATDDDASVITALITSLARLPEMDEVLDIPLLCARLPATMPCLQALLSTNTAARWSHPTLKQWTTLLPNSQSSEALLLCVLQGLSGTADGRALFHAGGGTAAALRLIKDSMASVAVAALWAMLSGTVAEMTVFLAANGVSVLYDYLLLSTDEFASDGVRDALRILAMATRRSDSARSECEAKGLPEWLTNHIPLLPESAVGTALTISGNLCFSPSIRKAMHAGASFHVVLSAVALTRDMRGMSTACYALAQVGYDANPATIAAVKESRLALKALETTVISSSDLDPEQMQRIQTFYAKVVKPPVLNHAGIVAEETDARMEAVRMFFTEFIHKTAKNALGMSAEVHGRWERLVTREREVQQEQAEVRAFKKTLRDKAVGSSHVSSTNVSLVDEAAMKRNEMEQLREENMALKVSLATNTESVRVLKLLMEVNDSKSAMLELQAEVNANRCEYKDWAREHKDVISKLEKQDGMMQELRKELHQKESIMKGSILRAHRLALHVSTLEEDNKNAKVLLSDAVTRANRFEALASEVSNIPDIKRIGASRLTDGVISQALEERLTVLSNAYEVTMLSVAQRDETIIGLRKTVFECEKQISLLTGRLQAEQEGLEWNRIQANGQEREAIRIQKRNSYEMMKLQRLIAVEKASLQQEQSERHTVHTSLLRERQLLTEETHRMKSVLLTAEKTVRAAELRSDDDRDRTQRAQENVTNLMATVNELSRENEILKRTQGSPNTTTSSPKPVRSTRNSVYQVPKPEAILVVHKTSVLTATPDFLAHAAERRMSLTRQKLHIACTCICHKECRPARRNDAACRCACAKKGPKQALTTTLNVTV